MRSSTTSSTSWRRSLRQWDLDDLVDDAGPGTPDPQLPSETGENGRGMYLIAAFAAAWGIEMIPGGGKIVWAELLHAV